MIKKIVVLVALVAAGGYLLTPFSPCDQPLHYKIGKVDSQFNLPDKQFADDVDQAGKIWSKAYGKNLFVYDPNAPLTISLIYDGRQTLTNQISQLQNNLDTQKKDLTPKVQAYQAQAADFKKKLADLNAQIESWNSKGGAPPDVYQQLNQQQQQLKQEADDLNAQAQALNLSTDNYNAQVGNLNQTVDAFNESLQLKPEEGLYDPRLDTIEIYFYINQPELIHTLAHEMGHSLGMDHNQNKQSILYPQTTKALTPSADDLASLQYVCRQRTMAEVIKDRLLQIYTFYNTTHS